VEPIANNQQSNLVTKQSPVVFAMNSKKQKNKDRSNRLQKTGFLSEQSKDFGISRRRLMKLLAVSSLTTTAGVLFPRDRRHVAQAQTSSIAQSKFLTTVLVCHGGSKANISYGWYIEPKIKGNEYYQQLQVCNWEKDKILGLYKLPNNAQESDLKAAQIEEYRYAATPGRGSESHNLLEAYKKAFGKIVQDYPSQHFGIKYAGHGTMDGLFSDDLTGEGIEDFLGYVTAILDKNIDFFDWSENCNVASLMNLEHQYAYVDYIVASDLFRRTPIGDEQSITKSPKNFPYKFFSPGKSIKQSLVDLLDAFQEVWDLPANKTWYQNNKEMQSLSIFDSSEYAKFRQSARLASLVAHPEEYAADRVCYHNIIGKYDFELWDVYNQYIKEKYPNLVTDFTEKVRFKYVNNRNSFDWDDANGLHIPCWYF